MDTGVNFYELKEELAGLGLNDPALVNGLRAALLDGKDWFCLETERFALDFARDGRGRISFVHCTGIHPHVNQFTMNTENVEYLKRDLLNLGFGDKVNTEMEKLIAARVPEFNLTTEQEYNGKKMDYTLHFKAGEQNEMYFFNRYDASLKNEADPTKDRMQTLYINKGHGVTAKEAFNLMEGRAVEKKLYTRDNEPYQAWLKLDFSQKDDRGNHKLLKFGEGYGYNLEKTLSEYPIKQLNDPEQKEALLRSLRKGNAQQVIIEKDGQSHKYYLVAEPQYKQVNIYDVNMKSVKRESLKQERKQQPDEDGPKKKQSRKQKIGA